MLTLTTANARRQFASLIARVHTTKQPTVLTRYGRPLVALVPMEHFHALRGGVSRSPAVPRPPRRTR